MIFKNIYYLFIYFLQYYLYIQHFILVRVLVDLDLNPEAQAQTRNTSWMRHHGQFIIANPTTSMVLECSRELENLMETHVDIGENI